MEGYFIPSAITYLKHKNFTEKQIEWVRVAAILLELATIMGIYQLGTWIGEKVVSESDRRKVGITEFVHAKLKETLLYKKMSGHYS